MLAAAAGLEGVDAFEKLKAEAAKADLKHPPKALELPMPKIQVGAGGSAVMRKPRTVAPACLPSAGIFCSGL